MIEYSLALFFSKLINYTFLYWLPRYIKESGLNLGDKGSADLSTLFDVGGIFGGIFAGLISDLRSDWDECSHLCWINSTLISNGI